MIFSKWLERLRKAPSDLVGIEVTAQELRVARVRKGTTEVTLTAADVLPRPARDEDSEEPAAPELPSKTRAKYVSLCVPGENAVVKYLSFPGQMDEAADAAIVQNMGLKDPEGYRIAYKVIVEGHARGESRLLAVAVPNEEAEAATSLFATGLPAPYSLELSETALLTAFLHGAPEHEGSDCIGMVAFGRNTTFLSLFRKGSLALLRKLEFGTEAILSKLEKTLGVNRATAQEILVDGAFDISQAIADVMAPLVKQLVVSRDFVERRENCQIKKVYTAGEIVTSQEALNQLRASLGVDFEPWNPLNAVTAAEGALPDRLVGQEWRFGAAIGTCLGSFEE